MFKYSAQGAVMIAEGEHLGDLLKEAPWKGAP